MYFDYGVHKPILAFLPFGFRSVLAEVCKPRSARRNEDAPQAIANKAKSTRGNKPKGMQKSEKKSAYIPYLDNIEITLMKIFVKSTEISGKSSIFFLNGLFSLSDSTLSYDRILVGIKKERWESLFLVDKHIGRCVLIDTTHQEVYLG